MSQGGREPGSQGAREPGRQGGREAGGAKGGARHCHAEARAVAACRGWERFGRGSGRACWKIDLVASAEGGAQVAVLARRHRSESEARMLMHTVRSSGWCSLLVLNVLASCMCVSVGPASTGAAVWDGTMAMLICWPWEAITSAGMVSVCCSWADRSRGSVRTDILLF